MIFADCSTPYRSVYCSKRIRSLSHNRMHSCAVGGSGPPKNKSAMVSYSSTFEAPTSAPCFVKCSRRSTLLLKPTVYTSIYRKSHHTRALWICHDSVFMKPEMHEGPEAFTRFQNATKRILTVPRAEIQERIEAHRREAVHNPNRRSPRTKVKPSTSDRVAESQKASAVAPTLPVSSA